MPTVVLSPFGLGTQFLTNAGTPLAGGKINTYAAGGTTPQATYTNLGGSVARPNPIVLDSAGRIPSGGAIWTLATYYKFVVTDSTGVVIATYDNIGSASLIELGTGLSFDGNDLLNRDALVNADIPNNTATSGGLTGSPTIAVTEIDVGSGPKAKIDSAGTLSMDGYLYFPSFANQPATSGTPGLIPNSTSGFLDLVMSGSGFRIIPGNGSSYNANIWNIDPNGTTSQAGYLRFSNNSNQPALSNIPAVFPNTTSSTFDFVGLASGWRWVPPSGASYGGGSVFTLDASGNLNLGAGSLTCTGNSNTGILATLQVAPGTTNVSSCGTSAKLWTAVYATNGTIQTSDTRNKHDLGGLDNALGLIEKLRPTRFKWRDEVLGDYPDESPESQEAKRDRDRHHNATHFGLMAQEVETALKDIAPDVAHGLVYHNEETDSYGLAYHQLIPVLIKAVQELNAEVKALKNLSLTK